MSILFETLQRLEGERRGFNLPPMQETEELLRCAEEKLASKIEAASTRQKNDGHLNGQPLQAAASAPALVHGPSLAPLPIPQTYATEATPVVLSSEPAPQAWTSEPAPVSAPAPVPVAETAPAFVPAAAAPAPAAASRPVLVSTAQGAPLERPTRMGRTITIIRAALPVVEALVAALDRNASAPASSAFANNSLIPQPAEPVIPLPLPVDLAPIDEKLGEIKTLHIELRDQIAQQNVTVNQLSDHLDGVRQSTDRNTRRQHELIEELRGVGKKVNFIAVTALGMTAVCVALNVLLVLHVFKIIP